jgi:hypothetical protein
MYTGRKLNWDVGRGMTGSDSPSLDRRNNERNIRLDNVDIISHEANAWKGNRTQVGYIQHAKDLSERFAHLL